MSIRLAAIAAALFLACILLANYVTTEYGMVPVGFGLTATAGTYLAGLTFVLRDSVQDSVREMLPTVEDRVYVPLIPGHPSAGYRSQWVARSKDRPIAAVMLALIAAGAALSYFVSDPFIALASGVAFLASETADLAVYTPLRERGYIRAAIASNIVGAFVDTVLFLWIAGFPIRDAIAGQMVGKASITLLAVAVVLAWRGRRAVIA